MTLYAAIFFHALGDADCRRVVGEGRASRRPRDGHHQCHANKGLQHSCRSGCFDAGHFVRLMVGVLKRRAGEEGRRGGSERKAGGENGESSPYYPTFCNGHSSTKTDAVAQSLFFSDWLLRIYSVLYSQSERWGVKLLCKPNQIIFYKQRPFLEKVHWDQIRGSVGIQQNNMYRNLFRLLPKTADVYVQTIL